MEKYNTQKKYRTEETKRKMSLASKGKPKSNAHRKSLSNALKGNKNLLGFRFSIESRKKMSNSHLGKNMGYNSGNWKGGVSKIDKLCRCMPEYKKWRSDVFQRDNWTCKTCNNNGCYVTAHHIISFSNLIKKNNIINTEKARECKELWDVNNGITLCEECHKLTDNYAGRCKRL